MMQGNRLQIGFMLTTLTAAPAAGDVATLGTARDNTLYESGTGSVSNGAGAFFFVGRTAQLSNFLRRGLVAFDIAGNIPAGSTIAGVELTLHMSRTRFTTSRITELHRATADWGEGTSNASAQEGLGAAATPGDATWLHTFFDADFWSSSGGDFSAAVSASTGVGGIGFYSWGSTTEMVADIQMWLDTPSMNFGWILTGVESTSLTSKRFDTRENATASNRPLLTIDFSPPSQVGACCDDLTGVCTDDETVGDCAAGGGRFAGEGSDCASIDPPCLPTGACCDDVTGACTDESTQAECDGLGFRFGGDASTCATIDPPCTPPPVNGACCDDLTGVCTDNVEQSECQASGGRFGGKGSDCASIDPPCLPTGACCDDSDGFCGDDVLQADCESAGLRFGGDASTCVTIDPPCEPPPAPPTRPIVIELEVVAGGLVSPVEVTHAGDGSGRLLIVDQVGQVRVVENGALLPTPFLDLGSKMVSLNAGFDERGLLGMAFHPDFETNGRFFVRYSAPRTGDTTEPCFGTSRGCHAEVLAEFKVSAGDPNIADPDSEIVLFSVDEPEFNHDGGMVEFGPDGFLYFALGDGGGANDDLDAPDLPHGPLGNGQDIETFLGAMLRIDVDGPPEPGLAFAIPDDNPFVGGAGLDEIYAYGFRNPFRFSFDDGPGGDGKLYLGDVGQNLVEEVDIVVKGGNYGWAIKEGSRCFDPFNPLLPPAKCPDVGPILGDPLIDPVHEYLQPLPCANDAGCANFGVGCDLAAGICENGVGISVIGGYVYRGSLNPALVGQYVFGDFSTAFSPPDGKLLHFPISGSDAFERREFILRPAGEPFGQYVKGFGEDEDGEIYVCATDELGPVGSTGIVYRIVNAAPGVLPPLETAPPFDIRKNRVISIDPTSNGSTPIVMKVELLACSTSGDPCTNDVDCDAGETCSPTAMLGFVSDPIALGAASQLPPGATVTRVQKDMPAFRVWPETVVHISDCEIAPVQGYAISASTDGAIFSQPLRIGTIQQPAGKAWGDYVASAAGGVFTPPNGVLNVDDLSALLLFFRGGTVSDPEYVVTTLELGGEITTFVISAADLSEWLRAFGGGAYPPPSFPNQGGPENCP